MKKRLCPFVTALTLVSVALPIAAKVTLEDVYKADEPKRQRDLAAHAAHRARHSSPILPTQIPSQPENKGWTTLYSGNSTDPIAIPAGVANIYVTTTTGQSYFIPVVSPASNIARKTGKGGRYLYVKWTGAEIKGERKTYTQRRCSSHESDEVSRRCWDVTHTDSIGITRVMID